MFAYGRDLLLFLLNPVINVNSKDLEQSFSIFS